MKKEYDLNKLKKREGKIKVLPGATKTQINIRLDCKVLIILKTEAYRLGIPYQTLIGSILHRYSQNELVDKKNIESLKTLQKVS
ncbi:MAG: hypothetical protein KBD63_01790 [Bacteriovoracaceae bacterium]|nr:hypothetical protein [Bacteriovoracaceae bacterium]